MIVQYCATAVHQLWLVPSGGLPEQGCGGGEVGIFALPAPMPHPVAYVTALMGLPES